MNGRVTSRRVTPERPLWGLAGAGWCLSAVIGLLNKQQIDFDVAKNWLIFAKDSPVCNKIERK